MIGNDSVGSHFEAILMVKSVEDTADQLIVRPREKVHSKVSRVLDS